MLPGTCRVTAAPSNAPQGGDDPSVRWQWKPLAKWPRAGRGRRYTQGSLMTALPAHMDPTLEASSERSQMQNGQAVGGVPHSLMLVHQ